MKALEKQKVIEFRKAGMTLGEIQKLVPVSKSTISLWMQGIKLSPVQAYRISQKITEGQAKSRAVLYAKALLRQKQVEDFAINSLKNFKINQQIKLLLCACLYECEGRKRKTGAMSFTNSDPHMIKIFLKLLRESFALDEKKLRVCVHLHDYHNTSNQLKFWSSITEIPSTQFIKPYMKKSSHIYRKEGYEGCINIMYYDVSVQRKLLAVF